MIPLSRQSGRFSVAIRRGLLCFALPALPLVALAADVAATAAAQAVRIRPFTELQAVATWQVGKTADWVAVTADAVWVGSTGENAVHRIDPQTNREVTAVALPGEPCAGLATGFGSLWVPLCSHPASLARVDVARNAVTAVFKVGPAAEEGGVATSADSVWLVADAQGSLLRIDPQSGAIRQTIHLPAGSYNPRFAGGDIWVTRAEGAEITVVDATSGFIVGVAKTGPNPRFLTDSPDAVWTLNQGDGSLSRIDTHTHQLAGTVALGTPGHGGDIGFGAGLIWTTMMKTPLSAVDAATNALLCQWVGTGGDSIGVGHGAIWLTDYHAGTISRFALDDVASRCRTPDAGIVGT